MKNILFKILRVFKNKYFIATLIFIIIIVFFDKNNLIDQYYDHQKLNQLQKEQEFYQEEINKNREFIKQLETNPDKLEKYGRETYGMKRDSEDVFLVIPRK